jgi:hypothetical protein
MNKTIRKYIISLALEYIIYNFDINNTHYGQSFTITENNYNMCIERSCFIPETTYDTYFEDYRIDFKGLIDERNVSSVFYIAWKDGEFGKL